MLESFIFFVFTNRDWGESEQQTIFQELPFFVPPHNNPLKEHNLFVDQQWSFKTNISRLLLGACN